MTLIKSEDVMKIKLLLFFCALSGLIHAQEPINNYFSLPMSDYLIVSGTIDQNPVGANTVWNFSTLTRIGSNTDAFTSPTATDLVDYPGTTQVLTITDNVMNTNEVFYKLDGATLSLTGGNNSDFTLDYNTDNALIGTYPLIYGDVATTDLIAGTITTQGQTVAFTGTLTVEADAYGTLSLDIVGEGSYGGDVTRIKTVQMISFTVSGIFPGTAEITSHNYYKDVDGALVFRTSDAVVSVPGLGINQISSSREALVTNTLSVANSESIINGIRFYPNPVKGFLNVHLYGESSIQSIEIIDVHGRTVLFSQERNSKIDVSKLETGAYFVIVTSKTSSVIRTLVKE